MEKTLGFRLRVERQQKGVTQETMAAWAGIKKLTQHQYEHDKSVPGVDYLQAIASHGIDIAYVLGLQTGVKTGLLSERERRLLDNYEALDDEGKRWLERSALVEAKLKELTAEKKAA